MSESTAQFEPRMVELRALYSHLLSGHSPILRLDHCEQNTAPGLSQRSISNPTRLCVRARIPDEGLPGMWFVLEADEVVPESVLTGLSSVGALFIAKEAERNRSVNALNKLLAEHEAIIDHIDDGILVLDRAGIITHVNKSVANMHRSTVEILIGRKFSSLVDYEPEIEKIFETKHGYVDRELHIKSKRFDFHIIDTAIPIIDEEGNVSSIVNTVREISRVKKLTNQMAGDRARYRFADVLGQSSSIREAIAAGRRAARSDANVLLAGESGTGKEVFAQSIHNEGRRSGGPFVAINCAALPRDLIESELFGYAPGSFTGADKAGRPGRFELASGGTIFLDEVSEMPLEVQAKLLRVLQERQVTRIGGVASIAVDVRVISAANRNLADLVSRSAFRADLFYRFNVIQLRLPALRERSDDIAHLTGEFIRRGCAALHRPTLSLSPRAIGQLEAYSWPGNIRQLQNVVERLVNMIDGDYVEEVPRDWLSADDVDPEQSVAAARDTYNLDVLERQAISDCLKQNDYNITKSSEQLGITRPTLYAKIRKFGLKSTRQFV